MSLCHVLVDLKQGFLLVVNWSQSGKVSYITGFMSLSMRWGDFWVACCDGNPRLGMSWASCWYGLVELNESFSMVFDSSQSGKDSWRYSRICVAAHDMGGIFEVHSGIVILTFTWHGSAAGTSLERSTRAFFGLSLVSIRAVDI